MKRPTTRAMGRGRLSRRSTLWRTSERTESAARYVSIAEASPGKDCFNWAPQFLEACREVEGAASGLRSNDDSIINGWHGLPLELAVGEMIKRGAHGRTRILHLADVMHPDVPGVARAIEGCE